MSLPAGDTAKDSTNSDIGSRIIGTNDIYGTS